MRRFWLIFAQTVTVCVAALFVVTTLRPDLLSLRLQPDVVTVREPAADAQGRPVNRHLGETRFDLLARWAADPTTPASP